MKFLDQLQNPPREFTAIPFWFLNGDLTAEELRRQLADFAAHGIYGVVLHPRMGLSPDITYLGERYFAHIRTAVEAAAALDMKIVLYDEGMYPSGSACGLVVKDHPELASEGITLTQTVLPEDELLAQAESGTLVVRKSGGTMRGLHWGEDDGEKNAPKTADILNPAAVSRFIELTHEAYYRELKEYFGTTIIGFFTDEPSILGRNVSGMFPWTHGFAEIFRRAGGNAANLTALFDGRENDDTRLYHKLLLQREGEVYYGTLSRWCKAHGIGLMGQRRRRAADAPPPQRQRVLWRLQQGRQPVAAFGRGHQVVHRLAGGARGQPVYPARLLLQHPRQAQGRAPARCRSPQHLVGALRGVEHLLAAAVLADDRH